MSYNNLANNLNAQGKYAQAESLYESDRDQPPLLTDDDHSHRPSYNNLAVNLDDQGKYAEAQPTTREGLEIRRDIFTDDHPDTAGATATWRVPSLTRGSTPKPSRYFEKALEITAAYLTDDHPHTVQSYNNLAANLDSQGKYAEAQTLYRKALEICRRAPHRRASRHCHQLHQPGRQSLRPGEVCRGARPMAECGQEPGCGPTPGRLRRAGTRRDSEIPAGRPGCRPGPARSAGRGVAGPGGRPGPRSARRAGRAPDRRLTPAERDRLGELTTELERLDRLVESIPKELDQAERAKQFEDLKRQREQASIDLGEFQAKLVREHGELEGHVASLDEIQAALPADAALVAWVDIPPVGPNDADPDGEHWGVVVRSRGVPSWVPIAGTGPDGLWSKDDTELASQVRTELRKLPDGGPADLRTLIKRLRTQRLEPLAKALGATRRPADGP